MRDEAGRTDPRANPNKGCPGLLVARMRSPHDDLGQLPAAKDHGGGGRRSERRSITGSPRRLIRTDAWLTETPLAPTRTARFTRI
jgi:hypothetical protein